MIIKKYLVSALIVFFFATSPVFSQATNSKTKKTEIPTTHVPEEYGEDEFPQALKDLRRAEIITIGSFPFTFLVANLTAGLIRYYDHDFDGNYTPGFLMGSANNLPYNSEYRKNIILASIGMSLTMALVDFIIGKTKHEKRTYRPAR